MDIQTSIEQGLLLLADMIRQLQEKGYETKSIETRAETVRSKLYQGMDETGMFHMDGPIPFANHWDPYFKIERTVFGKNEL